MRREIKNLLNKLPYVRGLYAHYRQYIDNSCFPPGHYYSPIVSVEEAKKNEAVIWKEASNPELAGIDLKVDEQVRLLSEMKKYYSDIPFEAHKKDDFRYYFENEMYSYTDGIILYSMLRHLKPDRIIEVGSGFSSALMLDVNQHNFDNRIDLHFIEPNPERLFENINENDKKSTIIIPKKVQEVEPSYFSRLEAGDILFIDSTHVAKTGSDVNYIFFEILPILKPGVWIHFHDIFYPFEYPKGWVYGGRNWNENYFLRAFLMNNNDYEIRLFPHYLHLHRKDVFTEMPLAYLNKGGNIWLEKMN
ncbi:MAG: class I SAM-dependent methyltransferase [Bacteroidia bacterium]|nr:class I SAM-dependent methyltransferase [Bacteroidia bacterium]NNF32439.1 class I SAM-dependent methyltransferase [Flavobacteriaceae bacterium]MBT8276151.1 class I SAM-dependent methyltransferase [Bacteroidia bacterium]NNJ82924.1 class I SAM-dependent methyltransferase [Flavobacteriaceae bacterium]NNK71498.1 class I SAM-dependent methyltransferase [Flavobacteriaceae bacterium]